MSRFIKVVPFNGDWANPATALFQFEEGSAVQNNPTAADDRGIGV